METGSNAPRVSWIALMLSFLSTGVGHIYCGRIVKGLVLYCAWLLVPFLCVVAAILQPSAAVMIGLIIIPAIGVGGLYLYAAIDAFFLARRTDRGYVLKEYNRGLVYGMLVCLGLIYPVGATSCVRALVFEAFYMPAKSMCPSIVPGDRLLVNKITARTESPIRGDVIVFHCAADGGKAYIKRVIAVAGDRVEMNEGGVIVNGSRLAHEPASIANRESIDECVTGNLFFEENGDAVYHVMLQEQDELSPTQQSIRRFAEITVPERSVFVLGDNRDNSRDSRIFGCVHVGDIIGCPQYLYWPWSRFHVFPE